MRSRPNLALNGVNAMARVALPLALILSFQGCAAPGVESSCELDGAMLGLLQERAFAELAAAGYDTTCDELVPPATDHDDQQCLIGSRTRSVCTRLDGAWFVVIYEPTTTTPTHISVVRM